MPHAGEVPIQSCPSHRHPSFDEAVAREERHSSALQHAGSSNAPSLEQFVALGLRSSARSWRRDLGPKAGLKVADCDVAPWPLRSSTSGLVDSDDLLVQLFLVCQSSKSMRSRAIVSLATISAVGLMVYCWRRHERATGGKGGASRRSNPNSKGSGDFAKPPSGVATQQGPSRFPPKNPEARTIS